MPGDDCSLRVVMFAIGLRLFAAAKRANGSCHYIAEIV